MNQIKRMKRFELSTLSLARRCSTTELHPQVGRSGCVPYDLASMHYDGALGQSTRCELGSVFINDPISRACRP